MKKLLFLVFCTISMAINAQSVYTEVCPYCEGHPLRSDGISCPHCSGKGHITSKAIGKYKYYLAKVAFGLYKAGDQVFTSSELSRVTNTSYIVSTQYDTNTYSKAKIRAAEYYYYKIPSNTDGLVFISKAGGRVSIMTTYTGTHRSGDNNAGIRKINNRIQIIVDNKDNPFFVQLDEIKDYRYIHPEYTYPGFDKNGNMLNDIYVNEDADEHSILYVLPKNMIVVDGVEYYLSNE